MASYYVYSGASGSANGTSWANAYTTLGTAFSVKAAGDTFYVAHDHSESSTTSSINASNGTAAAPYKVICVNRAGSVPPVSADRRTTAQIAPNSSSFQLVLAGFAHYDGIIFANTAAAISLQSTANASNRFDNCSFRLTGTADKIRSGDNASTTGIYSEWNNTTVSFSAVTQTIESTTTLKWRNTPSAILGTAVPTNLFSMLNTGSDVECVGVDLSAAGSGKTIVASNTNGQAQRFRFIDCKLNAAVTKAAAPLGPGGRAVDFLRTGASGINYTVYSLRYGGTLTEETTIVRTGGATDGTTPLSWKVVTAATCSYSMPFECPPIAIWNDTVGSAKTATIEGIWGGGAVPNDDDVWVDVEYLGDASSPQGSFVNDGKADLLTAAAGQTSSSATWGGSTTKFKLNVTFTAQQKGWVYGRVKVGKASSTVYVDPLIVLS